MANIKGGYDFDPNFFDGESAERTNRIADSILYVLVLVLNWGYEIYLQIEKNPFIILQTFLILMGFIGLRKLLRWIRENLLASDSIKKMD
jgi:hypothetical protein